MSLIYEQIPSATPRKHNVIWCGYSISIFIPNSQESGFWESVISKKEYFTDDELTAIEYGRREGCFSEWNTLVQNELLLSDGRQGTRMRLMHGGAFKSPKNIDGGTAMFEANLIKGKLNIITTGYDPEPPVTNRTPEPDAISTEI